MTHCSPAVGCCGPVETDAPLAVTVNPEARVNVARTTAPIDELKPGRWHTIEVAVVNDGFVTGPLVVEAEPIRGVELDLPAFELTGEHRQTAGFRIRFGAADVVDLTLTFRALSALGGLAMHSSVSLLLRAG